MQNDLISRSALIEKMNDTGVQITFDLPVEEILGNDVDIDDFTMLVQDAIQAYRKMIIGAIQNQPTAYDVEKVVEQLDGVRKLHEELSQSEQLSAEDKYIHTLLHGLCVKVTDIVRAGGKEWSMEVKDNIEKMGDRLLSENAVFKAVQKALIEMGYEPLGDEVQKIFGAIENTKTAYDVEKVVERVEALPVQDFLGVDHIPRTAALNMVKRNGNCELPENPPIDRLSGDYIRGYTKAIQDIKPLVIGIYEGLKHHRIKWSKKIISELFDCILGHRDKLREQRNGFIRWNVVLKKFEWFEPGEE